MVLGFGEKSKEKEKRAFEIGEVGVVILIPTFPSESTHWKGMPRSVLLFNSFFFFYTDHYIVCDEI